MITSMLQYTSSFVTNLGVQTRSYTHTTQISITIYKTLPSRARILLPTHLCPAVAHAKTRSINIELRGTSVVRPDKSLNHLRLLAALLAGAKIQRTRVSLVRWWFEVESCISGNQIGIGVYGSGFGMPC